MRLKSHYTQLRSTDNNPLWRLCLYLTLENFAGLLVYASDAGFVFIYQGLGGPAQMIDGTTPSGRWQDIHDFVSGGLSSSSSDCIGVTST